jgi:hypothetical protein
MSFLLNTKKIFRKKSTFFRLVKFYSNSNSNINNRNNSPAGYLEQRELLYQSTSERLFHEGISKELRLESKNGTVSCYAGFDPTSNCLHLGNFLQILTLFRLSFFGFKPIFLIGGATGMIGIVNSY